MGSFAIGNISYYTARTKKLRLWKQGPGGEGKGTQKRRVQGFVGCRKVKNGVSRLTGEKRRDSTSGHTAAKENGESVAARDGTW